MKKVLICTRMPHDNSYVGGVVSIVQSYLRHEEEFRKNGYVLDIFTYELSDKWKKVNNKIKNIVYIPFQYRALSKRLRKEKDVILHIHTSREFLFLKDMLLARMASKKYHIPVVMTIHVGDINTVFNRINYLEKLLIKWMNHYVRTTFLLSQEIKQQFIEHGKKINGTEVLYNFFDFNPSGNGIRITNRIEFLYVGAIHREKGIIELLQALVDCSDLDFHISICGIITDNSIKETFKTLVEKLGNKISVLGYITGEEKERVFGEADVLILPSYHEGMPLVILEALGAGLGIISTRVGTTPEILDDSNAMWVNVGDVQSLREKILLISRDSEILESMKMANLKLSKRYSVEEHIDQLCFHYSKL